MNVSADKDAAPGGAGNEVSADQVRQSLKTLQQRILDRLQTLEQHPDAVDSTIPTQSIRYDAWQRPDDAPLTGCGASALIEHGRVFERGGVNFSDVQGKSLPPSATANRPELAGAAFQAMGVSLVLHPRNPYVPTVHMNIRFFMATPAGQAPVWWFGGGMDLTPYYGFREDAEHFHRTCREALQPFSSPDADLYPRFKAQCDRYFYLKHRQEPRGIGGIFFDDFCEDSFENCLGMTMAVGDAFLPAYAPIVERRLATPYGQRERDFQCYRRGRYVEFNLVYDRGTHFGLQSGGRTESILMSMPPVVHWQYDWQSTPGSPEAELTGYYLQERDWL